jgi:ABC-type proline/glycine betaine transport system permease subunit
MAPCNASLLILFVGVLLLNLMAVIGRVVRGGPRLLTYFLEGFWSILRAIKDFGGFQIKLWPSVALFILILFVGVLLLSNVPAIAALYSLPIVRNTYLGLHDISAQLRESAQALGLPPMARLRLIELPLAYRSILAGIKTSASSILAPQPWVP